METSFINTNKKNLLVSVSIAVLVLLGIFLISLSINSFKEYKYIGKGQYPDSTITFSGTGEVFAVPDVATFNFSVTKTADSVAKAQEQVEDIISKASKILTDSGIEDKDIKTENYNVSPRYEYTQSAVGVPSKRVFVGYEVTQSTKVKVKNATVSGEILGKIGALEVTNMSSISFEIDDTKALERQAREMAIAEAKAKAEVLAKDLGVKLVRVISFYENSGGYPQPYAEKAMGGAMDSMAVSNVAPTLSSGQNKITSQVNVTYEIE